MGFKITSSEAIDMVKLLEKANSAIEHLETNGGKNKIKYNDLKKDLRSKAELWKEGFDLENFDEWKEKKS